MENAEREKHRTNSEFLKNDRLYKQRTVHTASRRLLFPFPSRPKRGKTFKMFTHHHPRLLPPTIFRVTVCPCSGLAWFDAWEKGVVAAYAVQVFVCHVMSWVPMMVALCF